MLLIGNIIMTQKTMKLFNRLDSIVKSKKIDESDDKLYNLDVGEVYFKQGKYNKAIMHYIKDRKNVVNEYYKIKFVDDNGLNKNLNLIFHIGNYYREEKNYKKSIKYFELCYCICKDKHNATDLFDKIFGFGLDKKHKALSSGHNQCIRELYECFMLDGKYNDEIKYAIEYVSETGDLRCLEFLIESYIKTEQYEYAAQCMMIKAKSDNRFTEDSEMYNVCMLPCYIGKKLHEKYHVLLYHI